MVRKEAEPENSAVEMVRKEAEPENSAVEMVRPEAEPENRDVEMVRPEAEPENRDVEMVREVAEPENRDVEMAGEESEFTIRNVGQGSKMKGKVVTVPVAASSACSKPNVQNNSKACKRARKLKQLKRKIGKILVRKIERDIQKSSKNTSGHPADDRHRVAVVAEPTVGAALANKTGNNLSNNNSSSSSRGGAILCLDVEVVSDGTYSQFSQIGAVLSTGGQTLDFEAKVGRLLVCK
jgi:hypothetical protein